MSSSASPSDLQPNASSISAVGGSRRSRVRPSTNSRSASLARQAKPSGNRANCGRLTCGNRRLPQVSLTCRNRSRRAPGSGRKTSRATACARASSGGPGAGPGRGLVVAAAQRTAFLTRFSGVMLEPYSRVPRMSLVQRLRLAFAVGASLLGASPVLAFEVDGYRIRMPLGEVQQLWAALGWRLEPIPLLSAGPYQMMQPVPTRGQASTVRATFGFCRGRLASYGTDVGDANDFVRLVAQETARLGQGRYSVIDLDKMSRPVRSLSFAWQEKTWETSLTLAFDGNTPVAIRTWGVGCS